MAVKYHNILRVIGYHLLLDMSIMKDTVHTLAVSISNLTDTYIKTHQDTMLRSSKQLNFRQAKLPPAMEITH